MRGIPQKFVAAKGIKLFEKRGFHPIAIAINRKKLTRMSLRGAFVWIPTEERDTLLITIFKFTKDKVTITITFEQARDEKESEKEKPKTQYPI